IFIMTEGESLIDPIGSVHAGHLPVTPSSVKAIISKIEADELKRAQEDISIQLSDILGNVNGVINRFQEDLESDLKERKHIQGEQEKGKIRFILLEKIASFSRAAETKERNLYEILNWMSDWGDSLSFETKTEKNEKEDDEQDEWVEVMERVLPLSLIATEGGIESLISLCTNLIEEKKKRALVPKGNFWKAWREKVLHKSSSPLQPLSPEQMLKDNNTTNENVGEVQAMLQELLDSTMFNKGEMKVIRYISTVIENLNQALILQLQENHKLKSQCKILEIEMSKEIKDQKFYHQKEIQVLGAMKHALEKQLQTTEQKWQQLLEDTTVGYHLQFGGGDRIRRNFTEHFFRTRKSHTIMKKVRLPTIEEALEAEMEPKFEEKEKSFLTEQEEEKITQLFPKYVDTKTEVVMNMGGDHIPFLKVEMQPLPEISLHPENSKDTDIHTLNTVMLLKPAGTDYIDFEKREVIVQSALWMDKEKDSDLPREIQEDLPAEESPKEKMAPSNLPLVPFPEKTGLSQEEQAEEERLWQEKRKQWQEEEKWWQGQQKAWEQLEKEHKEKQQQWKLEEEELCKKRQEIMSYKLLLRQRRTNCLGDLDELQAEQREDTSLPSSLPAKEGPKEMTNIVNKVYQIQLPGGKFQTPMIYESQLPSLHLSEYQWAPKHSEKAGPLYCIGRSFPSSIPHKSGIPGRWFSLQKEKKYRVDVRGQRQNLLLLNEAAENLGLPGHLCSLAKKLILEIFHINLIRLGYMIQKYSTYRMFQSIRLNIINHIQTCQKTGDFSNAQNSYIFLEKIDQCQSRRLQTWTEKQKVLEQDRGDCLEEMTYLFSQ
ncbi:protein FAM186B, partial [Gracilinanus agilis]|uniref:protein FAM186B n=1 Tax=Gracilinanus agilis TaxID=191870 RepID=UPI001CFE809C